MLHVRDCTGLSSNGDICPFSWCRKVKHLLYHLVSCEKGKECTICCPDKLSSNILALTGLNHYRRGKFRERAKAMAAAAAAAAKRQQMAAIAPTKPLHIARQPASAVSHNSNTSAPQSVRPHAATVPKVPSPYYQGAPRFPVAQPTLKEIAPNITNVVAIQQPSPALSACLPGTLSSLSVSALPMLEEAAMDIDDITLSASELMGS